MATGPDEKDADGLLTTLVGVVAKVGAKFSITLQTDGLLVSGVPISGRSYVDELAENVKSAAPEPAPKDLQKGLDAISKTDPEDSASSTTLFVHLRNVSIIASSGPVVTIRHQVLWRGRLANVDGWFFGDFTD